MNILAPSILAADFKILGEQIGQIRQAGAQYVHIDVMDGIFVPSISFGMPLIKSIRSATDCIFDVHLMITEPVRYIEEFRKSGADIITVHYEACSDVSGTLKAIKDKGLRTGLSVKPGTDVRVLEEYMGSCDMILIMSVEPGFGGQKFLDGSLERISAVRKMAEESGFSPDIEVDGGINTENVQSVLDAGANVIVAGSAVFRDPFANTEKFMKILNRN